MSPARFWLGMAQMGAATIAAVFLVTTGVSRITIAATLVATTVTLLSRGLHRRQQRSMRSFLQRTASTKSLRR